MTKKNAKNDKITKYLVSPKNWGQKQAFFIIKKNPAKIWWGKKTQKSALKKTQKEAKFAEIEKPQKAKNTFASPLPVSIAMDFGPLKGTPALAKRRRGFLHRFAP